MKKEKETIGENSGLGQENLQKSPEELEHIISETKRQLEAILFAAGRAVGIEELSAITKISSSIIIREAIKELKKEVGRNDSSLLLTEESNGNAWKLTIRDRYAELVKDVTPHTELDRALLSTLAVIAWKQPVLQSEIIKIRSSVAYEHIATLLELGFISKEKKGRSFVLKATGKFFEYFDLPDKEAVKKAFAGIDIELSQKPKKDAAAKEEIVVYEAKGLLAEEKEKKDEKSALAEMETEHVGRLEVYESEAADNNKTGDNNKAIDNDNNKSTNNDNNNDKEETKKIIENKEEIEENEEKTEEDTETADKEEKETAEEDGEKEEIKDEEEAQEDIKFAEENESNETNEKDEIAKKEIKGFEKAFENKEEKKEKDNGQKQKERKLTKELEDFAYEEKIGEGKEEKEF